MDAINDADSKLKAAKDTIAEAKAADSVVKTEDEESSELKNKIDDLAKDADMAKNEKKLKKYKLKAAVEAIKEKEDPKSVDPEVAAKKAAAEKAVDADAKVKADRADAEKAKEKAAAESKAKVDAAKDVLKAHEAEKQKIIDSNKDLINDVKAAASSEEQKK